MPTFSVGLVLTALGTVFLNLNVITMVVNLYEEGDARRDAGFSIFYMGINLGALLAPLVVGYLGQRVDWHYGFGAAGVFMVIGLVQYVLGRVRLRGVGERKIKATVTDISQVSKAGEEIEDEGFDAITIILAVVGGIAGFWAGMRYGGGGWGSGVFSWFLGLFF